jgi:hypothetical protein
MHQDQDLEHPTDAGAESPADASPPSKTRSVSVRVTRRVATRLLWFLSVAIAFGLGWLASSVVPPLLGEARRARQAQSTPAGSDLAGPLVEPDAAPPPAVGTGSETAPGVIDEPPADAKPTASAKPRAAPSKRAPVRPPEPTAQPEVTPTATDAEPATTADPAIERLHRAVRLADKGDAQGARATAEALLAEHESYSGLSAALEADGADAIEARLGALHVVHLAGRESVAVELAQELKRSYSATPRVQESIREWGLLNPRIVSVDSTIEDGVRLIVSGAIENLDVGDIRRVIVEVEALDAAGNVLAVERTRARPRSLDPGESGSFAVAFRRLDPGSVLRTRATVVEWDSEVAD